MRSAEEAISVTISKKEQIKLMVCLGQIHAFTAVL